MHFGERPLAIVQYAARNWPHWEERVTKEVTAPGFPIPAWLGILSTWTEDSTLPWVNTTEICRSGIAHPNVNVRAQTVKSLGHVNTKCRPDQIGIYLNAAWKDSNERVRTEALKVLARRVPPNRTRPLLLEALVDQSYLISNNAILLILQLDLRTKAIEYLIGELKSEDPERMVAGFGALSRLVGMKTKLAEVSEELLGMNSRSMRRIILQRILELIQHGRWDIPDDFQDFALRITPTIRRMTEHSDPSIASLAMKCLGQFSSDRDDFTLLLSKIRDRDLEIRRAAYYGISAMRIDDPRHQSTILEGLKSNDVGTVFNVLEGLNNIPNPSPRLQLQILPLTRHGQSNFRVAAWGALSNIDPENILPELIAHLKYALSNDNGETILFRLLRVLIRVKNKTSEFVKEFTSLLPTADEEQWEMLKKFLVDEPDTSILLVRALESPDLTTRIRAHELLKKRLFWNRDADRQKIAQLIKPQLAHLLATEKGDNLIIPLQLVEILGSEAVGCMPQIERLLYHPHHKVRELATQCIGLFHEPALQYIPLLRERMTDFSSDESRTLVIASAMSLFSLASIQKDLIPEIVGLMSDPDNPWSNVCLARRAARYPELAPEIAETVIRSLENSVPEGRRSVARAVSDLKEAAVPYIDRLCTAIRNDSDPLTREGIIVTLGVIGPLALKSGPFLEEWFALETSAEARKQLVLALYQIPYANRARIIAKAISDPNGRVRNATLDLEKIGDEAIAIIPEICRAIADPHWDNFQETMASEESPEEVYNLPESDPRIVEMKRLRAIDVYGEQGWDRRAGLITALQTLGPKARAAVPTLIQVLRDPHASIPEISVQALIDIGGNEATEAVRKATKHPLQSVREIAIKHFAQ